MKRIFFIALTAVVALTGGCASLARSPGSARISAVSGRSPSYTGPKVRIAVPEFEVTAVKAAGAGAGLRRMMVASLLKSGRFAVIDGQQKGHNKPADLMIKVAVVEFEPQASGGSAGIGGGGGVGSGLMGGLLGSLLNKAHLTLEIRIIDTAESRLVASTRVQGQASDMAGADYRPGSYGGWKLDTDLLPYANTPMEKAVRICVVESVRYISHGVPGSYYKYYTGQ